HSEAAHSVAHAWQTHCATSSSSRFTPAWKLSSQHVKQSASAVQSTGGFTLPPEPALPPDAFPPEPEPPPEPALPPEPAFAPEPGLAPEPESPSEPALAPAPVLPLP